MVLIHYGIDKKINLNGTDYLFFDFRKIEPDYSVPFGFHTRVYEKGVRHYVTDGYSLLYLSLNDEYCDRICNREGELARLLVMLEEETKPKITVTENGETLMKRRSGLTLKLKNTDS